MLSEMDAMARWSARAAMSDAAQEKLTGLLAQPVVRLNVGCGIRLREGYINIDVQEAKSLSGEIVVPDLLSDAKSIPLPDHCAHELVAIHIFEHFYRWEVEGVLAEWRRLLKPRGLLALELPDIVKCARNLLKGIEGNKHPEQLSMWGLYGDPRHCDHYMTHKWGWTPKTLKALLEANGFEGVRSMSTQFHPIGRDVRDMRIEATRTE